MAFEKKVPEWHAEGIEPPESLKTSGFDAGYKPPAPYFNWFWHAVSKCLEEIQSKLSKVDNTADSEKSVKEATTAGKVKNKLILRANGGSAEGTNQWTFDGSDSKTMDITPDKIGAAKAEHKHAAGDVTGLAAIATSGSYNDLKDIPEIPDGIAVDSELSSTSENPVQNKVVNLALNGKAPKSHATSATTYGAGTSSNYGHVKLSDETGSTSGVNDGVAATPAAVKAAYDLANGKAPSSHEHAASDIKSGTLAGKVVANASAVATLTNAQVRNIQASTTDLTAGSSALATGQVYLVYE